jgi:hypothetical protein
MHQARKVAIPALATAVIGVQDANRSIPRRQAAYTRRSSIAMPGCLGAHVHTESGER